MFWVWKILKLTSQKNFRKEWPKGLFTPPSSLRLRPPPNPSTSALRLGVANAGSDMVLQVGSTARDLQKSTGPRTKNSSLFCLFFWSGFRGRRKTEVNRKNFFNPLFVFFSWEIRLVDSGGNKRTRERGCTILTGVNYSIGILFFPTAQSPNRISRRESPEVPARQKFVKNVSTDMFVKQFSWTTRRRF